MSNVTEPPVSQPDQQGLIDGGWWHSTADNRIVCDLCPRECSMKPGDRGFCFVRQNVGGQMKLTTWGRSTGFCIDPIEKKPLSHFLPGTPVLSFGTAGCNLGCKFCQNWDISKSRQVEKLSELALPEMIAAAAVETGCRSVAYTYNDPIIWAEYAIDTAAACRAAGVRSVAVTAGYISEAARAPFFQVMDAANVDLKAFDEEFYEKITYSRLQPVLDTLSWIHRETDVWLEITNLMIPEANDSSEEIQRMCDWILQAVGPDVPVHFTAFHPDFRMTDRERTSHETLTMARDLALRTGLRFVYVGNVHDVRAQSTWCPSCDALLIERDWHQLGQYNLNGSRCGNCGQQIAGVFEEKPGTWGARRQPITISKYQGAPIRVPLVIPREESESMPEPNLSKRPELTAEQESAIHDAASQVFVSTVRGQAPDVTDDAYGGAASDRVMGAFVTVKKRGQLRGCIGSLGEPMPLKAAVGRAAQRTATHDPRFPPISPAELPELSLNVTLLYNFEPISGSAEELVDAVEVGRHGLRITHGGNAGLLLPVVAIDHLWDSETFLNQVCRKAGLPQSTWKDPQAQLERFEGWMIERELDSRLWAASAAYAASSFSHEQAERLAIQAKNAVLAILQGAVYGADISVDGTVSGMAMRLTFPAKDQDVVFSQMQPSAGLPLQSTLISLCQAAAGWIQRVRVDPALVPQMTADVILFSDPVPHGPASVDHAADIDPAQRAFLVSQGRHSSWGYEREGTADRILEEICARADISPGGGQLFSLAVASSAASISNANVPTAVKGPDVRQPAVEGRFYPSSVPALTAIVKSCFEDIPEQKQQLPAVMVPHAGLQYSGKTAAGVLGQVEIPDQVIIIGPKHTREGSDWAVAPHSEWQLPGQSLLADPILASILVKRIDNLRPDAAAHHREHCIEVELPFLAHLNPQTRVTGIVVGSGDPERCRTAGRQLAEVIAELDEPPLLIISSDMNHFADDAENRRLDEMALKAMESLDPEELYRTVRENGISMCGVLPAMIVMETLIASGQLARIERCGYATSGEVTGDFSRVVGYAGMLLS